MNKAMVIENLGLIPSAPAIAGEVCEGETPVNDATKMANRALEAQGFVLMCWYPGPKPTPRIGAILDMHCASKRFGQDYGNVPGPFRVIGYGTREEYAAQLSLLGKSYPFGFNEPAVYLKVVAE